ncbi:MAG: cysteine-rich CWC family protein [Burkholderiaceae bacterium]
MSDIDKPLRRPVCPSCGGPNQCAPVAAGSFETRCWCMAVTIDPDALARLPAAQRGQACLCPHCAGVGVGGVRTAGC